MLTCLHGTDSYRMRTALHTHVAAAHVQGHATPSVVSIDCADETASDALERQLKYPSFFGYQTIIVAMNAANSVINDILERFDVPAMSDIHCIAVQDTSGKGFDKKVLANIIRASNSTTEFVPLSGKALSEWAAEFCAERGSSITPENVALLTHRVGMETMRLATELEKLCAYAADTPIDSATIALLTSATIERDQWELSNAVAAHDKRAAIAALWRSQQEGTPDQLLIGSLASGLRNLLMVQDLSATRTSPALIAKQTGLHPFVVSKTMRGAMAADATKLKNAHLSLARLDRNSKEGNADSTDELYATLLSL